MAECARCGAHVTADYAAVFGTNEDVVHGCPDCRADVDMYEGAGADPDFEPRVKVNGARRGGTGDDVTGETEVWVHGGGD